MLLTDKKIAIIGAGPVGLTMATLLQQKGVDVSVYERDKDPQARIWGGTLDLHQDSGQLALKAAGLLENYFEIATPMGITITDEKAQVQYVRPITPENRYDNPEINRNDLRKILLDSLRPGTVVWDSRCINVEPRDGKWQLSFEDKPDAGADLLIIANGGMSKVRRYVTDTIPHETGTIIIQGDIPQPEVNCREFYDLCNGTRLMTAHQGNLLVANPYNNGSLTYGVIFQKPEGWEQMAPDLLDRSGMAAFLTERFVGWDDRYRQLFLSTVQFVSLPTRKLSLDRPWERERPLPITLIGDAAHLMPPFAGKGVNTGLSDALTLSQNLTNGEFDSIDLAINDYERKMFGYASAAQAESAGNEIAMRDPGFTFKVFFG